MKFLATTVFVLFVLGCAAQSNLPADSLHVMLKKIDNSSVHIAYNYIETLYLDENAQQVCKHLSGPLADKLIDELSNKNKVLVNHVIQQ